MVHTVAPYQSHHPTDAWISYQDDAEGFRTNTKDLNLEIPAELAEGAVQPSGDICLTYSHSQASMMKPPEQKNSSVTHN